jgi:hypothetical protein
MNNCDWTRQRKARKKHNCCECNKTIQKGEYYSYSSGIWEHEPYSSKTCGYCAELVKLCCHLASKLKYQDEHYPTISGLSDFMSNFKHDYGITIEQAACQL